MITLILTSAGWQRECEKNQNLMNSESAKKLECLEKKQQAALAAENIAFFIEQCNDGLLLLDNAVEKAENITENTVKKYITKMSNSHTNINGYLSQLSGLQSRLLNIESIIKKWFRIIKIIMMNILIERLMLDHMLQLHNIIIELIQ